jgi:hypothetical protein
MVEDVQGWLDTPSSNFGWILIGPEDSQSAKRFDSRENANMQSRPMLTVQYTATETDCKVAITGLDMNVTQALQVGDSVTFTASAINTCGEDIYYRFDLIPDYGTAEYDPANFENLQNFSQQNSLTRTFNEQGSWIMVVQASATEGFPTDPAIPIIGGSVTVE